MITLENVSVGYGGKPVVHGVTLDIPAGEFLGILGPNGCGKTTLLRAISGTVPVEGGQILVGGQSVRTIDRRERARQIAYLAQDLHTDLPFTVREIALLGRSPHLAGFRREDARDHEIAQQALETVGVAHLAERPITDLSGGERRRAWIAMCLAQAPEILLLDEPTNHLDVGHQISILDLIRRMNRELRVTVVAALHDLNLAAEYCDRLVLLNRGRVAGLGRPQSVLTQAILQDLYGITVDIEQNRRSQRPHVIVASSRKAAE